MKQQAGQKGAGMWQWVMVMAVCAHAAYARDVTGVLAAPSAAIAPGAELHLQLTGAQGIVVDERGPARVADPAVDMTFALTTAENGAMRLQAAIYGAGVPVWVTDAITVPAGEGVVDLGALPLHRPILPGGLVPLRCGATDLSVAYSPGFARLKRPGAADVAMTQDAANPHRYTDGALPDTTLTRLGNRATLIVAGTPLPACTPVMPAPLFPLRAAGEEPAWVLVADRNNMALTREDGVTAVAGAAQLRVMADGVALFAPPDMNLILIQQPCENGRLPYPMQATLNTPGTTLRGCAGDPLPALAGNWVVDLIDGVAMPEDDVVTLTIAPSGATGFAGCNRYAAALQLTGNGPVFAAPVATRISCVGPDMIMERGFLASLPRVTHARLNANGELELSDGTDLLIRAYR